MLFLCGANSCRSQMAEGWARFLGGEEVLAYSAGTKSSFVHPKAIAVMHEKGIDISHYSSKTITEVPVQEIDLIVTLCAEGAEFCPTVPGPAKRLHWPIKDPVGAAGSDDEILTAFRRARDEIEGKVRGLLKERSAISGLRSAKSN